MSERVFQPESKVTDYFLGDWRLCVRSNSLRRGDTRVELENRLVLLLIFFIENKGDILDKERILKSIWPGKVVNEDSLAVAISHLRKALGDNSRAPNFIKTVPGVGYQFIADAGPLTPESPADYQPLPSAAHHFSSKWWLLVVCAGAIVALVIGPAIYGSSAGNTLAPSAAYTPLPTYNSSVSLTLTQQTYWDEAQQKLTGSATEIKGAIRLLRDLLQQQPNFAPAYAAIAEAKIKLLQEKLMVSSNCAEALGLLNKSLRLDSQQPHALVMRGNLLFWCTRDSIAAERDYQLAATLNPTDDIAPMQYAQLLLAQGKFAESLQQVELSRQLNPLNYSVPTVVWIYQMQSRDDLALQELERINNSEPGDRFFHISAQRVYASLGRDQDAMTHWIWLMRHADYSEADLQAAQAAFTSGGLRAVNKWLLERKDQVDLGQYTPPLSWARYAIGAGELALALDHLEDAFAQRQSPMLWADVDPAYNPLRGYPRFKNIVETLREREPIH
jgi:DNA-binding winged helix-turn-helix (wHTH) protein